MNIMRDTKGDNKQQQIKIKIEEMVGVYTVLLYT